MCCNTNEFSYPLMNTLFNVNRCGCYQRCLYNGNTNCWNYQRRCPCNYCQQNVTTQNGTGGIWGNTQVVSIPVNGRLLLYTGGGNCGVGFGTNGVTTVGNYDCYYARQYGLTPFLNAGNGGND